MDRLVPFLITGIIFFVAGLFFDHYLKKKYVVAKNYGWTYHHINKLQYRTEIILALFFLITSGLFRHPIYGLIAYLPVLNGFRAYMEWKYEREKKRYVLFLFSAIYLIIFFCTVSAMRILPL
ncbi:DUF4181 domain-containing protein [Sporolactobacillus sp. STCC-11]|uniref:DUF4181 domain-containing protein n=1 Tax=Sporolactobacillus caesalpiniae TaxID=3230362 RepID=UPI00339A8B58